MINYKTIGNTYYAYIYETCINTNIYIPICI